jgi:CDP-4-dehydro-6-deoxyglucose reductase, E1
LVSDDKLGKEEKDAMIDVIHSGKITCGPVVKKFEEECSDYVKSEYAVMVNSGSSAILLALSVALNPARQKNCGMSYTARRYVLVSSVFWSTSVAPIVQLNCSRVYVDVDKESENVSYEDFKQKVQMYKPSIFVAVHVLGNFSNEWGKIVTLCEEQNIVLIEDSCEAMGSIYGNGTHAGTFGDFGCYLMFYSYTITSGEGGVVTCKTLEDYDLLLSLRAHGWTREVSNKLDLERLHPDMDSRFLFTNVGFNIRPLSIQAALASVQLKKLDGFVQYREGIYARLCESMRAFSDKFSSLTNSATKEGKCRVAWHGFPMVLCAEYQHQTEQFKEHLSAHKY